jgi:hypothetical protein
MTDRHRAIRLPRVPAHVVVMLSAATAGYAATLACVAGLQAADEAALAAARAPAAEKVAALSAAHDRLAADLEASRMAYGTVAGAYDRATATLESVDRVLADLASAVAKIDGVSRSLPTSVRIPVPRTVVQVRAPATHATTRASGG